MANNKDFKVKNGIQPTVYHEGVGTVVSGSEGYSLSSASYDSKSFDVAQSSLTSNLTFKPDGTKMYVVERENDSVYQYSLSTAWDVSTASYDTKSFSFTSQEVEPYAIAFNSDGTSMYTVGYSSDTVYQYTLSTAYDVSTASYASKSLSVSAQDTLPINVTFSPDGTSLYINGAVNDTIYQYTLSTSFDVSTGSYASKSFSHSSQDTNANGFAFNADGTKCFILGNVSDQVHQYSLTTAYDISTASYDSVSFSLASQDTNPFGLSFSSDGTKMYALGSDDFVYQYSTVLNTASLDLSTGSVFEITPTSDIQVGLSNPAASGTVSQATLLLDQAGTTGYDLSNAVYSGKSFNVAGQDIIPTHITFNTDGTKMYVTGLSNDTVYQYSLSTAFDVSTASYDSVSFSISGQMNNPRGTVFNTDGTKMYIIDNVNQSVFQYSLSTAFDLSTTSYDSVSFSVASQETVPFDVAFNNAGTKMYIVGQISDTVFQYSLSTAFDLSTASYDSVSFSVASQALIPYSISFNATGSKMFVLDNNTKSVLQYSLSTDFNLSTASYDTVSFTITQMSNPVGMVFNANGTKMYVVGTTNDTIYQYSTVTPATITYPSTLEFAGGTAPTSPAVGETDVITFSTTDGGTSYQAVQAIDGAK